MSKIEYFHVFESIIYGLICSNLLLGFSRLISSGKELKLYWNHLMVCIILFIVVINNYYHGFSSPIFSQVTSGKTFFFYVVLKLIVFYFASNWLFPADQSITNYREFFDQRRKSIYLALFIGLLAMNFLTPGPHAFMLNDSGYSAEFVVLTQKKELIILPTIIMTGAFSLAAFHKKLIYSEVSTIILLLMAMITFLRF